MIAFIDAHKDRFGVEPICRVLPIAPSTYHDARRRPTSARAVRDTKLKAEIDGGRRPGVATEQQRRLAELERENRELRRANEILKSAAAFFGAELDRRPTR